MARSFFTAALVALAIVLFAAPPASAQGFPGYKATPAETVTTTREHAGTSHSSGMGDHRSPVVTYKGNMYYGYVDAERRAWAVKRGPTGVVQSKVVISLVGDSLGHMGPSLGIDKNGYVHFMANMHHSPFNDYPGNPYAQFTWQYWVSELPEDVNSLRFVGDQPSRLPAGTSISYPQFARDNNGVLFLTYRHRVRFDSWSPGEIGAALSRHDANTRTWTMLGGQNYPYGATDQDLGWKSPGLKASGKTFFWAKAGYNNTAYQGYRTQIFFDRNNVMHLAWGMNDGSPTPTNEDNVVFYAKSMDGGSTFRRADGTLISGLPVQPATADRVFDASFAAGNTLWYTHHVGVDSAGRLFVSAFRRADGRSYIRGFVPGSGWAAPRALPHDMMMNLATDRCGVITAFGPDEVRRSSDGGATWRTYTGIANLASKVLLNVDKRHLADTGSFRFEGANEVRSLVTTVRFSGIYNGVCR